MNVSLILLSSILFIIFLIIINEYVIIFSRIKLKENINNDISNSNITAEGDQDSNLLIPTSDQVYNPNDTNRTDNQYGHQVTVLNNSNIDTVSANTDPSIPIVYSKDLLEDTTIYFSSPTPSNPLDFIDSGSGPININPEINNIVMNDFNSIN
jgi:hypothetical protein